MPALRSISPALPSGNPESALIAAVTLRVPVTAVISMSAPVPPPSVVLPPALPLTAPPTETAPFAVMVTLPASPESPPPFTLSGPLIVASPPASRSIVPPPSSPPEELMPLPPAVIDPCGAITDTSPPTSGAVTLMNPWMRRSPPLQVPWLTESPQSGTSSAHGLPALGPPTQRPRRSISPPYAVVCVPLASRFPSTCIAPRAASVMMPPCALPLTSIFPFVVPLASTRMSPVVTIESVGKELIGADPRIEAAGSTRTLRARMVSVPDANERLDPGRRSRARPPKSSTVSGSTVTSAVTTHGSAVTGQRSDAFDAAAPATRGSSTSSSRATIRRASRMRSGSKRRDPVACRGPPG